MSFSSIKNILLLSKGESYRQLARYILPETITALLLFSALAIVDAKLIADLGSTTTFATLGIAASMVYFMIKVGEAFMTATSVVGGRYNGALDYKNAGRTLVDAFWMTVCIGALLYLAIYTCAPLYYRLHHSSPEMITMGVKYIRLKGIALFLMFIYLAFVGFLRALKDTRTPMLIFLAGASLFVFFDIALIKGVWGFPRLGLNGSAVASICQYLAMVLIIGLYVKKVYGNSEYEIRLFSSFTSWQAIKKLLTLTWPVLVDKSSLTFAFLWMGIMVSKLGVEELACYTVLRDLLALGLIPAQAAAHVTSFIASNNLGSGRFEDVTTNCRKILFITLLLVFLSFTLICSFSRSIVPLFDKQQAFTTLAVSILLPVSLLTLGDVLQLLLSGTLRGLSQVRSVMWVRILCCVFIFPVVSYCTLFIPIQLDSTRFLLLFSLFYLNFLTMSFLYIKKLKEEAWKMVST